MSSRLLKKFLKEKTRDEIKTLGESLEEEVTVRPKKKNVFAYLGDSDGSADSQTDGTVEEGNEKVACKGKKGKQSQNGSAKQQQNGNAKQSHNGNAKQSHNGNAKQPQHGNTKQQQNGNAKKKKKKKKNLDQEIDNILHTMNAETKQKKKGPSNGNDPNEEPHEKGEEGGVPPQMELPELSACTHEKYDYCLKLEKGNFDVNIELKRIFGKDFVKEKKFIQKSKIKFIKNWLIQDYTTKIVHPPIAMKKYLNEFKLEKYSLYLEAENLFYVLLDTHDIEAMHNLIKKYPFHVDTLLVLSEYYNESNNFEVANKFTKLALLILQHVFHMDFHPNHLNKERHIYVNPYLYDNKALFKALYMHMMSLENEACTITSLEVAKLLCKIDVQFDLCSILLRIDSLILKCNLFEFLIYFSFNFVIQNVQCVVPPAKLSQIINTSFPSAKNKFFHDSMRFPEVNHHKLDEDMLKRQAAQYYFDQEGNLHEGNLHGDNVHQGNVHEDNVREGQSALQEEPTSKINHLTDACTQEGPTPITDKRTDQVDDAEMESPREADWSDGPLNEMDSDRISELSMGSDESEHSDQSSVDGSHDQCSIDQPDEQSSVDGSDEQSSVREPLHQDEPLEQDKPLHQDEPLQHEQDPLDGPAGIAQEGRIGEQTLQSKLLFDNFEIRLHFILPNFAFSLPLSMYLKNNNVVDHQQIRLISVDDLVSSFTYEECRFLSPHCSIRFDCHRGGHSGKQDRLSQSDHAKNHLDSGENDTSALPQLNPDQHKKEQVPSLSFSAHLTLLRALLCFPNFLHTFLNYNNFKTTKVVKKTIYETSFKDILASPPFSSPSLFREGDDETVQKLISCYLEKNNIYYKSEKIITWFHVCSAFLHDLYKDPAATQALDKARTQWHSKIPLLDINKYKDVRVGEFKSNNYLLPDFMMEKNRTYTPHITGTPSNYYVSLNSNLIIAFFQSLLPWYQVDYYGTHSRPVYFTTLIQNVVNETKRLFNFE
ncbi:hypothetical protein AK88_01524 [Plasmodium fragile]|uniref:Transcription factor 25 n=1 Tax=Plasmodium fragile TaxID=5857 RepID=A0A0D9QP55_PLAFR|nr:uncharacterized protein AK88_01524 [Plasmodium fragile]KJP88834.1 hypothetical protein AK88_01524 [Plasmodium fragile]